MPRWRLPGASTALSGTGQAARALPRQRHLAHEIAHSDVHPEAFRHRLHLQICAALASDAFDLPLGRFVITKRRFDRYCSIAHLPTLRLPSVPVLF